MPVGQHAGEHGGRPRAGRGNNHARVLRAIVAALLLACLGLAGPARAQALPDENPLVQRNVPAEATAENAVVARDRALAAGQRLAYGRMATQLGLPANATDQQIEAQVASLVIESERITPRGYSARITVNFRPPGSARGGPSEAAAPGEPALGPAIATQEATARFRSLGEYLEIARRLRGAAAIARVELVAISGEGARFRLGLRSPPETAAPDLVAAGLAVAPGEPGPQGAGWRLGLAAGR
jgi:hypothetical protein